VQPETVEFSSRDGLTITADAYDAERPRGYVLLCHRSHFNRGEYRETGPKLAQAGYSCLAVDLRSGMKVLGVTNETYRRAKEQRLATGYLAAKPDVEAAIDHAYLRNGSAPVVLAGSSYSASLALLIAAEGSRKLRAVVAFSPGEHLKGIHLADQVHRIALPTLVLSSQAEAADTAALLRAVDPALVSQFTPAETGAHGSRMLWTKTPGHQECWSSLLKFFGSLDKRAARSGTSDMSAAARTARLPLTPRQRTGRDRD
jgi:dienelactone hydrolase